MWTLDNGENGAVVLTGVPVALSRGSARKVGDGARSVAARCRIRGGRASLRALLRGKIINVKFVFPVGLFETWYREPNGHETAAIPVTSVLPVPLGKRCPALTSET
jgi:hypothetical protein